MAGKGSLFLVCSTSQLVSRIILVTCFPACFLDRSWNSLPELSTHTHDGMENMAARRSTRAKLHRLQRWFGKKYHFYAPCYVEYSSINKMAKYDWNTFRNYVAFLAGGVAPGTRHPHHDSELISCYHDAFRTWGHYQYLIISWYLHVRNGVAVAAYSRLASRSQAKFHTKKLSPLVCPCAAAPAQSTTSAHRSLDFRRATSSQRGRWVGSWPLLLRSVHEDTS